MCSGTRPASLRLKEYYPQIDLLFPEWMHVLTADGRLQAVTELNTLYNVMDDKGKPRPVDERVMPFLKGEKAQTEVLPLVNNFDPLSNEWRPDLTAKFMADPAARQRFRSELMSFLATDQYKGITLDIEAFPETSRDDYRALVQELYDDLHAKGLKLYIAVPVNDKTFDYAAIAQISDGLILMNYDQHYPGGDSGPVAAQDWFVKNLQDALKVIPKEKIICAVGNYGYDWAMKKGQKKGTPPADVHTVSAQDAWLEAEDAETDVNFDDDAMNPHFAYLDDNNVRHDVWFLDGVTVLNQMRVAHSLGILHLRIMEAGLRRPLAVGGVGQALRGQRARQARHGPSRSGCGHRRAGRNAAHRLAAGLGRAHDQASIPIPIWSPTRSSRTCRRRTWSTCTAGPRKRKLPSPSTTAPIQRGLPRFLTC